jgi:hypothetical protein
MRKFQVEQPHYHCLKLASRMLAAYSEHHVSNPTSICSQTQHPLWRFRRIGDLLVDAATEAVFIAADFRHARHLCVKLLRHDSLRQLLWRS